jgi:hypothetical protein
MEGLKSSVTVLYFGYYHLTNPKKYGIITKECFAEWGENELMGKGNA